MITDYQKKLFDYIVCTAAGETKADLCLLQVTKSETGEKVTVLCLVKDKDTDNPALRPVAELLEEGDIMNYEPPEGAEVIAGEEDN